jgi:FHA domain
MGAIRESSTGATRILEPCHVIGRVPAPRCSLTLDEPHVSAVHAELRWTGVAWEVKDLGSRNGTYLDGRRLDPSAPHRIGKGSRLAFGRREREWEMLDASPPAVMAVPLGGGHPVLLSDEFIALPSSDDPRATIYRTIEGAWVLESADDAPRPLADLEIFEAVGRLWRFSCSEMPPATLTTDDVAKARLELGDLDLTFSVSRDEEHVHLGMRHRGREIDMGSRRHNYLLLTLARRRLGESTQGVPDTSCGWIDQEELAHDPSMAPPQLNIDVFRIREQFAKTGVADAAGIIERRPGQLRFGTSRVSIIKL